MPPYGWLHFERVMFVLGVGLILAIGVILARLSRTASFTLTKRSEKDLEDERHEFGGGLQEYNKPMPLLIWLVFLGYFVWAAGYVIFSGAFGL
ncbi:MAG: hypothetical protein C4523_18130 [Myxococcales bacterium]|nr:MAG: hypothetical protein C4523_18130 [Myxococcales bacterium]